LLGLKVVFARLKERYVTGRERIYLASRARTISQQQDNIEGGGLMCTAVGNCSFPTHPPRATDKIERHTKKKVTDFPVPSQDVTNQTFLGRE